VQEALERAAAASAVEPLDKKRGYNSMQSAEVSVEDMEAYRINKIQREDPMAALLNSDELLEYKK